MVLSEETVRVSTIVFSVNCLFNSICSIITLFLIKYMLRNGSMRLNIYNKCVIIASFYQMLYDTILVIQNDFGLLPPSRGRNLVFAFGIAMGGIGASVYATYILFAVLYTVKFSKNISSKQERVLNIATHVVLLGYSAWCMVTCVNNISLIVKVNLFSHLRLGIIVINFAVLIVLYYEALARSAWKDRLINPVYNLIMRLWWYPVVQCITRFGAMVYNVADGWSQILSFMQDEYQGNLIFLWLGVFLMPSAGFGMFAVFLKMQNDATAQLKKMMKCKCALTNEDKQRLNINETRISRISMAPRMSLRELTRVSASENPLRGLVGDVGIGTAADVEGTAAAGGGGHGFTMHAHANTRTNYTYTDNSEEIRNRLAAMDEEELFEDFLQLQLETDAVKISRSSSSHIL